MEFRNDINGLRAVAVIAVMLYHFGIPGFSGGFTGVDVFFVISGFLMTGIIFEGVRRGDFSFRQFYLSRCRRILPALAVLCLALLVLGWFWLPSADYKMLGRHASAAVLFVTNFVFKNEAGYFDTFSNDKFLLHTWSLSLEWQFYLIYPVIVAGVAGWLKRTRKGAGADARTLCLWLCFLGLISYVFCVYITPTKSAFAFYLLPTRIWELLAGAVVYLALVNAAPKKNAGRFAFVSGLLLVFSGIVFFDKNTIWPGYWAAVPVLGTALVIWGGRKDSPVFVNSVMQKIGIWSYSIYLWHWPVMVAIRHFGLEHDFRADIGGVVLSVALGAVSYYVVESPFRRSAMKMLNPAFLKGASAVFLLVILASGFSVDKKDGFPSRVSEDIRRIEQEVQETRRSRPKSCAKMAALFSATDCEKAMQPDFVVLGDSHAPAIYSAIEAASEKRKNGRMYHMTCPPFPDAYVEAKDYSRHCPQFFRDILGQIAELPEKIPVFFVFRYAMYLHGPNEHPDLHMGLSFTDQSEKEPLAQAFKRRLVRTLCDLAGNGRNVYVIAPIPEMGIDVSNSLARQIMFQGTQDDISLPLSDFRKRQESVMRALDEADNVCERVELLDPAPYLCSDEACHAVDNRMPLYSDDNHLSNRGIMRISPLFKAINGW